jgi:glucan phosphoethanolaminetransferase (alkaline phosphatase superfamily)
MNPDNAAAQLARRFALDVVLWYCLPAVFMAAYLFAFSFPVHALPPHLRIMAAPFVVLTILRLTIARYVPSRSAGTWIAATLLAVLLAAVALYYALVLGGLRAWGGVISWNMIPSYVRQAPAYLQALGVPWLATSLAAAALFVGLVVACRLYLRRFDWTNLVARSISATTLAIVVAGSCLLLGAWLYTFSSAPPTQSSEPVSLTFFKDPSSGVELQGHSVDRLTAATLDRREDAARAAYVPAASPAATNLVLIVIDAQRSDHMSIYGYDRDTTPNLRRLAQSRDVRTVEDVHASCPDTACGMLSLSSSKFPRQFSFQPFTLQQVMRRNGYRVHMILGGDHTRFYSLKEFYGPVETFYDGGTDGSAAGYFMNDDQLVLDRLAAMPQSDGAPTMFQFHLMSTHMLSKHDDAEASFTPARSYVKRFTGPDLGASGIADDSATNYYDNGVLKSDRVIQSLLAMLDSKGYLRKALVVVTADHGEGLGEHGKFIHMNSVREEVLRIPLLLIAYGYEPALPLQPRAVPAQVDIAPTILAELGVPAPSTWVGQALQRREAVDSIYFEGAQNFGLIDRRDPARIMKYWASAATGREHVFDLTSDPHEQRDLLAGVTQDTLLAWRAQIVAGTPLQFAAIP